MANVRKTSTFNRKDRFVEGWYWALRSDKLRKGQVHALRLMGRDLVLFRGQSGKVVAMDAYCPHMGAHLAEGRVDGDGIRCFFHDWKFGTDGHCEQAPCQQTPPKAQAAVFPAEEKYGLIWVWTGEKATRPVPFVPELGAGEVDSLLGGTFEKNCHPNVMMINAIDENHFNSVHNVPVELFMEAQRVNENVMTFSNTTKLPTNNPITRFLGRFYEGPLTYSMCYWFGGTGSVTVGPDFQHFHIMFCTRLRDDGGTEGQTVLVTKKRDGALGRMHSIVALGLSKVVGDYFAKGDTMVFQTIKFDFKTPTKADHAIIHFIQHVEAQKAIAWGTWEEVPEGRVNLTVVP
jgi:phenylpropionate dioxygenase-like ring-hydroxylating dioxygenase large terminal subunit